MAKEEMVSSEEEKKQTSLEGEEGEGKELHHRDEPVEDSTLREDFQTLYEESLKTLEEGQILR